MGLMKFDIKLFSPNVIYLYHVRLALLLPFFLLVLMILIYLRTNTFKIGIFRI